MPTGIENAAIAGRATQSDHAFHCLFCDHEQEIPKGTSYDEFVVCWFCLARYHIEPIARYRDIQKAYHHGELFEQLADIEHKRWSDWQAYMHATGVKLPNGTIILNRELVDRWERQIDTPYSQLTEVEQDSDRAQVRRYWPLIARHIEGSKEHAH